MESRKFINYIKYAINLYIKFRMDLNRLQSILVGTLSPDEPIRKAAELELGKVRIHVLWIVPRGVHGCAHPSPNKFRHFRGQIANSKFFTKLSSTVFLLDPCLSIYIIIYYIQYIHITHKLQTGHHHVSSATDTGRFRMFT